MIRLLLKEIGAFMIRSSSVPGPGIPEEAGISLDLIKEYGAQKAFWEYALDTRLLRRPLEDLLKTWIQYITG